MRSFIGGDTFVGSGVNFCFQFLGQLGENRHIAALAALSLGDEDHLPVKEKILNSDIHKLRNPRAGNDALLTVH
jgi:hypothetical protein